MKIPKKAPCPSCGAKRRAVAGADLRKARERAGHKNLTVFARRFGYSPSYLSEIETDAKTATGSILALYESLRPEGGRKEGEGRSEAVSGQLGGRRVRVSGDLFHGKVPEGAVYVGRAAVGLKASPFQNPYPVKRWGDAGALKLYREHLDRHPEIVARIHRELAGKDLACWCPLDQPCHADELLRRLREEAPDGR